MELTYINVSKLEYFMLLLHCLCHCCICTPAVRSVLRMSANISCSTCGETFSKPANLDRHKKIHDIDWNLKCEHCWFKTKRRDTLKNHTETYHIANNNYQSADPVHIHEASADDKIQHILPKQPILPQQTAEFDKRLQLPNNFIYAGSTQSVSFNC